ncbi:NUCLEOLAR PROTEIN GAR2-LIKE PROTEIN [Salix koriyanagi]|uniref:NUCLEOLAR PROTEIN GAR2-LIKE PROTEIN n=1 Tax=Salix koriyanagi TaxID=2511006 RepID=A0A9Q1APP4_9ROSI|nr:NUCLEOLAR PROTEIN GAR2-LIKE PROTEIN [Salix koriyanagi]
MLFNDYVLLEQEVMSAVACPSLQEWLWNSVLPRLDVAMFNAILRESAHEIPTDPVSDPILDSKVLPIPAGDLSFGSGSTTQKFCW